MMFTLLPAAPKRTATTPTLPTPASGGGFDGISASGARKIPGKTVDTSGAVAIVRAPWTGQPRPDAFQRKELAMFAVIRTGGKQ